MLVLSFTFFLAIFFPSFYVVYNHLLNVFIILDNVTNTIIESKYSNFSNYFLFINKTFLLINIMKFLLQYKQKKNLNTFLQFFENSSNPSINKMHYHYFKSNG